MSNSLHTTFINNCRSQLIIRVENYIANNHFIAVIQFFGVLRGVINNRFKYFNCSSKSIDSSPNLRRVIVRTSRISQNSKSEFRVKVVKMTLKVKVNDPYHPYKPNFPMMHVWCKFGDSSSNLLPCGQSKF